MSKVILVCGLPGVGKTTYCRKLVSTMPNAYFLDGDDLFMQQGGMPKDHHLLSDEQRRINREAFIRKKRFLIDGLLRKYDTVITDGLFTHQADRDIIGPDRTIRITCPERIVRERIFTQSHILSKEERWQKYLKARDEWEPFTPDLEVDSSNIYRQQ